ncbi:MAG: glycerol-3-phosphate 1-O-acyltransferase PlsY [Syntrophobacterales bacterium]|nr:glycerol-3-phosphate 1-O-acyltransferase PlsY [Syntrophobacterales bacterium]
MVYYPYDMYEAAFVVAAYIVGSIPVGVILSKLRGKDPRNMGSGNIGATNVMRTAGKVAGIITLAGDMAKGFAPTFLALRAGFPVVLVIAIGFAAFVGHLFPVFLRFKGGKGVATALGVYLALTPIAILLSFVVFVLVLLKWRYVSAGSIAGTAVMPLILYSLKADPIYVYLSLAIGSLIILKHLGNIKRLTAGTEHKIGSPK